MSGDKNWIQTFTGKVFHPLSPQPGEIEIRDIAHALSLLCRFNGHCGRFYSVAEHSVRVSAILPGELALWGLLHDAAEAYLSDLPRPVKRQMPRFQAIEDDLLQVITGHFGLTWPMPGEVATADTILLATEARDLMTEPPQSWNLGVQALEDKIDPWSSEASEKALLDRFAELTRSQINRKPR